MPAKKIFRPPWANQSPEPATSRKENVFQEAFYEEDDRPLSDIMSKEPAFCISATNIV